MAKQKRKRIPEKEEKERPAVPHEEIEEQEVESIPTEEDEIDKLVEDFLKEDVYKEAEERVKKRQEKRGE